MFLKPAINLKFYFLHARRLVCVESIKYLFHELCINLDAINFINENLDLIGRKINRIVEGICSNNDKNWHESGSYVL